MSWTRWSPRRDSKDFAVDSANPDRFRLDGVAAECGAYATVTVREKRKKKRGWRERSRLFKLC